MLLERRVPVGERELPRVRGIREEAEVRQAEGLHGRGPAGDGGAGRFRGAAGVQKADPEQRRQETGEREEQR